LISHRKHHCALSFKSSAHFEVRKEMILMRPTHTYSGLLLQFQSKEMPDYYNSHQMCCAMERMWHIFFGQPPPFAETSHCF